MEVYYHDPKTPPEDVQGPVSWEDFWKTAPGEDILWASTENPGLWQSVKQTLAQSQDLTQTQRHHLPMTLSPMPVPVPGLYPPPATPPPTSQSTTTIERTVERTSLPTGWILLALALGILFTLWLTALTVYTLTKA